MTTNKLPEWRKSLNEAVENYQSTRAWYEENQDSPSAEQDMDAAAGEIEKLIKQYGVLIVLNLLDEIDELQERRKADSAELIYQYRIRNGYNGQVTEWQTIRRDQVDFVLKAQPLNAEFRIISAPQPAPVVPEEKRDEDGNTTSEFDHGWNACRAAMLQAGNSTVTPDGWQLVPKEPTQAMNKAGWDAMNEHDAINPTYRAMLVAAPQQEVKSALEIGMSRYAGAMQKLADSGD